MTRAAALLLLLMPAALTAQTPRLRIAGTGATVTIEGATVKGAAFYPAAALARFGTVTSDARGARAVIFGDTLVFRTLSPFFTARGAVRHLAFATAAAGTNVLLPEQFFIAWLPARYPRRIEYAGGELRVRAAAPLAAVPEPAAAAPRRVVVIDPGHGGRDPGKIGPNGLKEKDAALAVSKRLADVLRGRGYEVHLTRTRDTLISLGDRPHMANEWKANRPSALFVSIHMNSVSAASVRGFETFFLAEARTEDERRVAEMENAAAAFEDGDAGSLSERDLVLNGLRNDFYVRASADLAQDIQESMAAFQSGPDRGVKRAGFRVLVGAFMPAVLVEVAFLSNPREAALIARSGFQRKVASGIADAVGRFFDAHEHLWAAGSS